MNRFLSAIAVSIVFTWSAGVGQSASTQSNGVAPQANSGVKTVVTGCIEVPRVNGSIGGTGVGTSATSPNTADDDANSSRLANTFVLAGATPATSAGTTGSANGARPGSDATASAPPSADSGGGEMTTYLLEGHDGELRAQLGHRVEVTGRIVPAPNPSRANASGVSRLIVDSVRTLSADCSKPVPNPVPDREKP